MNIRLSILVSATALATGLGSGPVWPADGNIQAQLTDAGKSFLDSAAVSDKSDIELSQVAATKSQTQAVRSFAQQMVDDQSNNYRDLQTLCDKKRYIIAPQLDGGHLDTLRKLQSASGDNAFDRAYVDAIISDQSGMESMLERIANNSNDSDIARFASDTLMTVKKHEELATGLAGK